MRAWRIWLLALGIAAMVIIQFIPANPSSEDPHRGSAAQNAEIPVTPAE